MSKNLLIFAVLAGLTFAQAAWADVDYPCFNACVKDGKAPASTCLGQCTKAANNAPTATDYRCLTLCKEGGESSSACMSRCSYNPEPASSSASGAIPSPRKPADMAISNHNVLQAPVPTDSVILAPLAKTTSAAPDKNYACIEQCLHDGMQYQLCNQNCAAVTPEAQVKSP
jgi:hypothetical protein